MHGKSYVLDMDFVRPIEAVIPGAQGRVLAVLAETSAELNLRTIARLAGVSPAQAVGIALILVGVWFVGKSGQTPAAIPHETAP